MDGKRRRRGTNGTARRLAVVLCCALVAASAALPARAEWVKLALPTGGTLRADLEIPQGAGTAKLPAVIYMHSLLVREIGYGDAADRGYDVAAFARAFADKGYVGLAPVRTTPASGDNGDAAISEGLSAILAGMKLLRARPDVDPRRIAVAGFGEGATIVLWALARMPDIAAGIVMSPAAMDGGNNEAKTMSFEDFIHGKALKAIRAPLLITVGDRQNMGARDRADALAKALIYAYKHFRYIHTYRGDRRWFWTPRDTVMRDVDRFLRGMMR